MAGYRLKKRQLRLDFTSGYYEGAEVTCNLNAPGGAVHGINEAAGEGDIDEMYRILREDIVIGWNLEDDEGVAIELTEAGFMQVDHNLIMTIIRHFMRSVGRVDDPLDVASPNGATPGPALAQMGNYTESRPNHSTTDG